MSGTQNKRKIKSKWMSVFCKLCCHKVHNMKKHEQTEEHKRNMRKRRFYKK